MSSKSQSDHSSDSDQETQEEASTSPQESNTPPTLTRNANNNNNSNNDYYYDNNNYNYNNIRAPPAKPPEPTISLAEFYEKEKEWKKKYDDMVAQKDVVIRNYGKQLFELQNTVISLRNEKNTLSKEKDLLQDSISQSKKELVTKNASLSFQNQDYVRRIFDLEKRLGLSPSVNPSTLTSPPLSNDFLTSPRTSLSLSTGGLDLNAMAVAVTRTSSLNLSNSSSITDSPRKSPRSSLTLSPPMSPEMVSASSLASRPRAGSVNSPRGSVSLTNSPVPSAPVRRGSLSGSLPHISTSSGGPQLNRRGSIGGGVLPTSSSIPQINIKHLMIDTFENDTKHQQHQHPLPQQPQQQLQHQLQPQLSVKNNGGLSPRRILFQKHEDDSDDDERNLNLEELQKTTILTTSTSGGGGGGGGGSLSDLSDLNELPATEALALELAIHRRVARIVYESNHAMDKQTEVTVASKEIFDWLSTENTFIDSPKYFSVLIKVIQSVATKSETLSTIDVNCYWLSTVSTIYCSLQKHPNFSVYSCELENLIKNICDSFHNYFLQVVSPNLISIFCQSVSTESILSPRGGTKLTLSTPHRRRRTHPVLISAIGPLNNSSRWDISDLITFLSDLLLSMRRFLVPIKLSQRIMENFMASINKQMVNKLMSCKELCTAANGFQIKLAISQLEEWLDSKNVKICVGSSGKKFKLLNEVATVLTLEKSSLLIENSTVRSVCPNLNVHQIHRLIVSFQPDSIMPQPVPQGVIKAIENKCKEVGGEEIILIKEDEVIKPLNPQKLLLV